MTNFLSLKNALLLFVLAFSLNLTTAQTFWSYDFSDQAASATAWTAGGTNDTAYNWSWTNVPTAGAYQPGAFAAPTASTGYMWFDSDANGNNAHDVTLTTAQPINCTGKTDVKIRFFSYFRTFSGTDVANVGVSTDGVNFTYYNIPAFDALVQETTGNPQVAQGTYVVDANVADGASTVWIQFRYDGLFEYYWKVDDIEVYTEVVNPTLTCDMNPNAVICDDFDSYVTTQTSSQQGTWWTTWSGASGTAEDGIISTEQAASAPNSLKLLGGGTQDVVLNLGNQTTGRFGAKWKFYVPAASGAYYNIQNVVPISGGSWNGEINFEANGTGEIVVNSTTVATFTYPKDTWFTVDHDIDLDNDIISYSINGVFVKKLAYPNNIGGINLYPRAAGEVYYMDDLEVVTLPARVFDADVCASAVDITPLFGSAAGVKNVSTLQDNTTMTAAPGETPGTCFGDIPTPIIDKSMWYTFTGDGNKYHIETVPCNATNYIGSMQSDSGDTQIAVYTGDCVVRTQVACGEDLFSDGIPDWRAGLDIQTVSGTDYLMLIDGFNFNGTVATGEFCIQIEQVSTLDCASANIGAVELLNNGFVCINQSTAAVLNLPNPSEWVLPNIGPAFGLAWCISTEALDPAVYPAEQASYWGSFGASGNVAVQGIVNDNDPLTHGVWFFTPVIVAGAVDNTPATPAFLHQLDVTNGCFFVGESQQLALLPALDPLAATTNVVNPTGGLNNGGIDLTVTGGFAPLVGQDTYVYEWSTGATTQDIANIGVGTYVVSISDLSGCADDLIVTVVVSTIDVQDPASVKQLQINPNPSNGYVTMLLSLENAVSVRLELFNALGQNVITKDLGRVQEANTPLDFSALQSGTYKLRVVMDGETTFRTITIVR